MIAIKCSNDIQTPAKQFMKTNVLEMPPSDLDTDNVETFVQYAPVIGRKGIMPAHKKKLIKLFEII